MLVRSSIHTTGSRRRAMRAEVVRPHLPYVSARLSLPKHNITMVEKLFDADEKTCMGGGML